MRATRHRAPACEHGFADAGSYDLGEARFRLERSEGCGAVLLRLIEEPCETGDALRNAAAGLEALSEAVDELAAFEAREAQSLVLALDRGWPAIALVLALEERPRFFTTALTDEETERLVAWLTGDPAAGFLAELAFGVGGGWALMPRPRRADPLTRRAPSVSPAPSIR